jgi:hypothetical protein
MPEVDKLIFDSFLICIVTLVIILEMNCHDDYAINGISKEAQIFWYIVNIIIVLIINYLWN